MKLIEFIDIIRDDIGDETHTYNNKTIVSWINTAIREFRGELVSFSPYVIEDTIELSSLTEKGEPAISWRLDDDEVGEIVSIKKMRLINDMTGEDLTVPTIFVPYSYHNQSSPCAKKNCSPCSMCCEAQITLHKNLNGTYLKTDRPLPDGTIAEITYEFMPKWLTVKDMNKEVPLHSMAQSIVMKLIRCEYHRYNVDDARRLAEYENADKEIYQYKNTMARNVSDFIVKRSF